MMLLVGDLIRVRGKWYLYHYYIFVGPIGPNGEDLFHIDTEKGATLVHSSVLNYEEDVCLVSRVYGYQNPMAIQTRAIELLGRPYHATLFNCEQGASYVQTGNANSPQLNFFVGVAVCAAIIQAVKKATR